MWYIYKKYEVITTVNALLSDFLDAQHENFATSIFL